MKAMAYHDYGPPEVLRLEQVDKPIPRDGEVLIRNRAVVASTAEMAARNGRPLAFRLFTGLRAPRKTILGGEFAGDIEAVGKGVTRFGTGDPVFGSPGAGFGTNAEYKCLPEGAALAPIPAGMTYAQAAAAGEGGLTALPFLRDTGRIEKGQDVLVNGASGTVGSAAVQLAKHFGAHVTGVCSTRSMALVESLGADVVLDYTKTDFTGSAQAYDIIFDAVGKSSFSRSRHALKRGGVYLTTVPGPAILLQTLWTSRFGDKRAAIALTGLRPDGEKAKDLRFIKGLCEAGEMRPVVDREYPLEEMAQAHRYVETGHKQGSVVLTV